MRQAVETGISSQKIKGQLNLNVNSSNIRALLSNSGTFWYRKAQRAAELTEEHKNYGFVGSSSRSLQEQNTAQSTYFS